MDICLWNRYKKIVEHFGMDILHLDGTIDRKRLGEIVFSDEIELEYLNSLIHPGVREYIDNKLKESMPDENFVIESAILVEAGYKDICDEIWYIYVDESIRRTRLKSSRGYTNEKIDSILNNQLSDEEFRKNADIIIDNSKSVENTEFQIKKVVEF